ncbi:hypothetical protein HNQ91_001920 [Filimonas zeae]|uniref:Uncharacterized protein n=1 Tax=Filimonas zeae TaxID=1737353 RepID=A0A917MVG6_9BACT|nr:hypothetical protein [Filimonas zeae]MDR6338869.1 hypothetical protein [Filimonas zeae]GGH66206.1 hypothetical protein GCM10011379_20140 [Filimonas zeae]
MNSSVSYPNLKVTSGLLPRKKSLKDLYRFCVITLTLSLFAFICNNLTAQTITSVLHSSETDLDMVKWYWRTYSLLVQVLSGTAAIASITWIVYLRWMLPERLRVKNYIHLPKYY